jgi:hypothetical protein
LLIFVAASGRQGARQSGGVEQLVLQAEARIAEAVRLKDLATLQASLADEFLLTVDTGAVLSKAQFIDGIRKSGGGDVPDEEVLTEADEVRVHVYGGVAVLSCRRSIVDSLIIGEFSGQWRETSVFVNRQGRWLLASSQRTLIRLR